MKKREIKRIERAVAKGNPDVRLLLVEAKLKSVRQEVEELSVGKQALLEQYHQQYENWFADALSDEAAPTPHDAQLRQAQVCLLGGLAATAIEVLVTGKLAQRWGASPVLPGTFALLLPLVLKTAIVAFLHDEDRPHETLRRLRLFILGPALGLFALAVSLLLLARAATESLADLLLPLFNMAPLALGLGGLGLAAGLFAQWHQLFWSQSVTDKYRKFAAEEARTRELLDYLEAQQKKLHQRSAAPQPPTLVNAQPHPIVASKPQVVTHRQKHDRAAAFLPLLLLPALASGCGSVTTPATAILAAEQSAPATMMPADSANSTVTPPNINTRLYVIVDGTDSVDRNGRQAAVEKLLPRLPELCESTGAQLAEAYAFARNGWDWLPVFSASLPAKPKPPEPRPVTENDLSIFGIGGPNAASAKRASEEARKLHQRDLENYRADLGNKLAPLTAARIIAARPEGFNRCTDLNGALARISQLSAPDQRQQFLLITDGVDTCTSKLVPVTPPKGESALVILLTSSQATPRGNREFLQRAAALKRVCPWAVIRPYFVDDYLTALQEAGQPQPHPPAPPKRAFTAHSP